MSAGRQRRRTALLLAVAIVAAGCGLAADATQVLRAAELATVDARFDVRGTRSPPADVVMVGLDDRSVETIDERPPIRRRHHARVIERLSEAGARVIVYDFDFTGQTSVRDDNALLTAMRRAGTVIVATTRVDADGRSDALGGARTRRFARTVAASANFPERTQRGGVVRRLPYAERGVPSLAVAAARRAGAAIDRDRFSGDGAWIDVPGPAGTVPTVSFLDVRDGRVPASRLRGKVVVVGATALALGDIRSTAAGDGVPGAEIHAAAVETLLRGIPLRDAPGGTAALWIVLAGALTPLAAIRLTGLRWLPVPLLTAALSAVIAQAAFGAGGRILPFVPAVLALGVGSAGSFAVAYATDLRDRRRLHALFSRFVPAAVVDEVAAAAGEDLRLGGVRRDGTVLFCDLRGFTSAAEPLSPEEVIGMLNVYLTEMSDAILDAGGTVVSFMGDGIMAVFGAPLPQDDHADRALRAAAEMLGPRLRRFHEVSALTAPLDLGVGVASGPVMSGNVGSPRRVEYTAVGDTTNTAARLEGMTKETGVPILIADSTRQRLRDPGGFALEEVGDVAVRGREATVRAWTLRPPGG